MEATQAARLASREHYNALKNKKEELERLIEEKEAELRRIKIEEAKLTGIIPDDLTEEEKASLPKQMATSYTLQYIVDSDLFKSIQNDSTSTTSDPENDKEVKRLSREYEIQCNIVKANYKIYKGTYTSKKIKKQRKKNHKASEKKLKELEKALERRRDFLGISCRQSRFYSQVSDKEEFSWEVLASKSFTMPHKQQIMSGKLSSVDENRITPQKSSLKTGRHSSALPGKVDTSLLKIRQVKHNTSSTVYNKKSNASDSLSTASPLDGSSFLSLYSRDSSSRLSSSSVTSDEDRCISCPATEELQRKITNRIRNDYTRQKRVSQHLDLALPEKPFTQKKDETIEKLNLDTPHQVIFKPPTRYPDPTPTNSLPFSSSSQSPRDFYARSLPLDYDMENEEPKPFDTNSANFGKYQFTSNQITKQQYEQKLAYTQHNSIRCNRTPSPHTALASKTNYPMPYMRVNSVPYGLHSSKSPSHEKINSVHPVKNVTSYSQTHLSPHHAPYSNSYTAIGADTPTFYYQPHSNGTVQTLPITRIHTTPTNITTLEYAKPTHYPRAISPKLKNTNAQTRFPPRTEPRISPGNPILSQPYARTQNPATNKYIAPACRIQITPPETQEHCIVGQHRYKSPYSHQQYIQTPREDRYCNSNTYQTYLSTHSHHDPLAYTISLPMPAQDQSPGVKCKIDYWEYHSSANAGPTMHVSQSLDKLGKKSPSEFSPPPESNRQSLNFSTKSHSFRNAYHSESNTSAYQHDYSKGMQPASDEGTPV